ncbi:hypothetical protein TCCBUS3UF1_21750 [Thermus sp. CCB_US3_UF1]|uniref:E3 binding domain-containing protein n=1 Tax=Thermus sp. CCB_US3_UF1 TaxID=1111069 RepID=UPI000238933A|nr:E3 binding domain-containing protein [Thermus sp. CCB_US3_UF1]AEV17211.1 hypothetical protein TCCBUS3UF1_21750 [Thermus sp. CCB_US3_UF1]
MAEPKITPLARRLAEENGIDWRRLQGTGPEGTIVERDILAFLAKVMAGEVDLPPMPEEPPPLLPEEELKRAQAALSREGVDLTELIPEGPKTPTLEVQVEETAELDLEPVLLEDLDLDLDLEEGKPSLAPEPLAEEWEEELLQTPPPPPEEVLESFLEDAPQGPATPLREDLLSEEELLAGLEEVEEQAPPSLLEEPLEAALEEPPPAQAVPQTSGLAAVASTPPPTQPLWVWRRRVALEALEAAQEAFQRVHGLPKTPLPFLLKAAERALAELELPYRPLLGQVTGEGVRGLRPAPSFLALFRQREGEAGEGLLCLAGEEEVHTGRPSLFLSPEGVLSASGLEGAVAKKLLERVALYLENPVLLLA